MLLLCTAVRAPRRAPWASPRPSPGEAMGTTGTLTSKDAHVEPSIDVGQLILENTTSCVSCGAIQISLLWMWL